MFFVHTTFFFGRESTLARKAARQIAQLPDRRRQANVGCPVGAYLALTVGNVFVFHAHAFNIALLLAVDPPTAQEAETKPGAQWEAVGVARAGVRVTRL